MDSHINKLTHDTIDELETFLSGFSSPLAMNIEALDGFFAALHCCSEMVPPSEYLPQIWGGGDMPDGETFESEKDANHFFSMIMDHYNNVGDRLSKDTVLLPLIDYDADCPAEQWAQGFLRGMFYDGEGWSELLNDEDNGGSAIVVLALANENNPDPEMRSFKGPVSAEKREELICYLAAGVTAIYKYFAEQRRFNARLIKESGVIKRSSPKIGRNTPCPCGSGKKYKKCCAAVSVH